MEHEASDDGIEPTRFDLRLRDVDLERLDRSAQRRGVNRETIIVDAIDAYLAREMWSGAYIPPPPAMELPPKWPWSGGAFRLGRRKP